MKLNYEDIDKENIDLANKLHNGSQMINPSVPRLNLEEVKKENSVAEFFAHWRIPAVVSVAVVCVVICITAVVSPKVDDMFNTATSSLDGASRKNDISNTESDGKTAKAEAEEETYRYLTAASDRGQVLYKINDGGFYTGKDAELPFAEDINSCEAKENDKSYGLGGNPAECDDMSAKTIALGDKKLEVRIEEDDETHLKMYDIDTDTVLKEHTVTGTVTDYFVKDNLVYVLTWEEYNGVGLQGSIPLADGKELDADKLYAPDIIACDEVTIVSCFGADDEFELKDCVAVYGECKVNVEDQRVLLAISDYVYDETDVDLKDENLCTWEYDAINYEFFDQIGRSDLENTTCKIGTAECSCVTKLCEAVYEDDGLVVKVIQEYDGRFKEFDYDNLTVIAYPANRYSANVFYFIKDDEVVASKVVF